MKKCHTSPLLFIIFFLYSALVLAESKPDLGPLSEIKKLTAEEMANGPELSDASVNPYFGTTCMNFTYMVRYKDKEGRPPTYVRIWHDYRWHDMQKLQSNDENYKTGVLYYFSYIPTSGNELFYYFETSNGIGKARSAMIDSPDQGPLLYSEKLDNNQIILLDKKGNKLWSYDTKNDWVEGVAISKDGKYIATVTGYFIRLFSIDSNIPIWGFCQICDVPEITMAPFNGIAISADGNYMAGTLGETLYFFGKDSNKPLWKSNMEASGIGVAISDNGDYVAVGVGNAGRKGDSIFLFNKEGQLLWKYKAEHPEYEQTGNFYRPAMTPTGSEIATSTGCPDRKAYLFSRDGSLLFSSNRLTRDSPVHKSAISDDGKYAVYVADQEQGKPNLFLFSNDGKQIWNFSSPDDATSRAVSMSGDGKYIASGTLNGKIYFFSRDANTPLWKFTETGNFAKIGDVKLNSNGSLLAAVSSSKKIYLFSRDNNNPLWTYDAPTYATFVDFNGEYIVVGTGAREYQFEGNSASKEEIICKEVINPKPIWETKETRATPGTDNPRPSYCGNGICEDWNENKDVCAVDCAPADIAASEKPKQSSCLGNNCSKVAVAENNSFDSYNDSDNRSTLCGNGICESGEEDCCEDCGGCNEPLAEKEVGETRFFSRILVFFKNLFKRG